MGKHKSVHQRVGSGEQQETTNSWYGSRLAWLAACAILAVALVIVQFTHGAGTSAQASMSSDEQRVERHRGSDVIERVEKHRSIEIEPPPDEPPLDQEKFLNSIERVDEQQPVTLQEVGQQLRYFCADELDVPGTGGVRDGGHGGPPTHKPPITENCQTFNQILPGVSIALELGTDDLSPKLTVHEAEILDKRLVALMRMQVHTLDVQYIVLRLADQMSGFQHVDLGNYNTWPKSLTPILVDDLIYGSEQQRWEKTLKVARKLALSAIAQRSDSMLSVALDAGTEAYISLAPLSALACQATMSDHAWDELSDEEALIRLLESELKDAQWASKHSVLVKLAILGAYRPLLPLVESWESLDDWRQAYRKQLQNPTNNEWTFWQLWRLAVEEPLVERNFRTKLAAVADPSAIGAPGIAGAGASHKVRAMYENNPYPKWSVMLPEFDWPKKMCDWLESQNWHAPAEWPSKSKMRPKVLVAGCGTGKWLTHFARHYQGHADVWAVDLSLSSLSFASRKAEENGLRNIRFVQGDILNLPEVVKKEAPFDLIETGGVLHHLQDPKEGWARLVELLRPGGPMLVGLYSRLGRRRFVEPCRNFAFKGSYNASTDGTAALRRYRRDVFRRADAGEEWAKEISSNKDFASLSGVRDACLHVQETQYTLLDIKKMLRELGLKFLQMHRTMEESEQKEFSKLHNGIGPFSSDASLVRWHAFETMFPTTFADMYQLLVQKV